MGTFKNPDVWKKNLAYQIGDFALYNGTVYMAIKPVPAGTEISADYWTDFSGGGGEDKEFIAAIRDRDGFKPFTGTLSVGGEAISYTVETFFAGTEDEFEGAVASVPAGSVVTYAITESGTMNVFESKEAFLNLAAPTILSAHVYDSVVVPASNFLCAIFDVSR